MDGIEKITGRIEADAEREIVDDPNGGGELSAPNGIPKIGLIVMMRRRTLRMAKMERASVSSF